MATASAVGRPYTSARCSPDIQKPVLGSLCDSPKLIALFPLIALASYLISIPGLTIPKFQFLYHYFAQRPDLLTNEHWSVLRGAHGIALDRGVKEDSPEYFGFLHSLLN